MSDKILIDMELEAIEACQKLSATQNALNLSNATTSAALKRIESLNTQRRTLARHILRLKRGQRLDRRELRACADEIGRLADIIHDHQMAILRLAEERDHLRVELVGEKAVALVTVTTLKKDLESAREESFRIARQLRRIRSHRRFAKRPGVAA